jgi:hypothetical protein
MKKSIFFMTVLLLGYYKGGYAQLQALESRQYSSLERYVYSERFEEGLLGAWASYPHWQDLAYDQNFRIGQIQQGDTNTSIVQKVTPYSNVDNYGGAQKLLDMYLVPGSKIAFRYFVKSHLAPSFIKVRLAAGALGTLDVTINHPTINQWVWASVGFDDFVRENTTINATDPVHIYALLFLVKIPGCDPEMPFYIGLDDISFEGAREKQFQFALPAVTKLPEFAPFIPLKHYVQGEKFSLKGSWDIDASRVNIQIVSFTDPQKIFFTGKLLKRSNGWELGQLSLNFPAGLYRATLSAYNNKDKIAATEFTLHIAAECPQGQHPRLLFDVEKQAWLEKRFRLEKYKPVLEEMEANARLQREKIPVSSLVYDLDQFPDENWLPSWDAWGEHSVVTGEALKWNALSYVFNKNEEAGRYAKDVLVTLAGWKDWASPWQTKRGRLGDHRTGTWSHSLALAYDLTYPLMTEAERQAVRNAFVKNIVEGVHQTFVYDDNITGRTSNWIAMTVGGSLMTMAAMFNDGKETENIEPYFTGALLKYYSFINKVSDSLDGGWGEGLGYNEYSFTNMSMSLPSLQHVFNIDLSAPLVNSYNEYIWSGVLEAGNYFHFGDAARSLTSFPSWAFLLNMRKEPRLSWLYHYFKKKETWYDVLFDIDGIPQDTPLDENPDKVFRKIGTTVFKGGWGKNDFSFSMRTGAFFNHQHMDQGSFMLSDRGVNFIVEREGSTYYDDPIYQSSFIQPVAHSTILINGNHQSQRVGDGFDFAPGLNDHAFIEQYFDGRIAGFSSGNIGKLYWGKVNAMRRNNIFIKPGILLMLDEIVPGSEDVDVSLLYQTPELNSIKTGDEMSTITRQGVSLNIFHLSPQKKEVRAVETPHYLITLQKEKPLVKEGIIKLTARTGKEPLIVGNLFVSSDSGQAPAIRFQRKENFVYGEGAGRNIVFRTKDKTDYTVNDFTTDALAMVWNKDTLFVVNATRIRYQNELIVSADAPVCAEIYTGEIHYAVTGTTRLKIPVNTHTRDIILNGRRKKISAADKKNRMIEISVPEGSGFIKINQP